MSRRLVVFPLLLLFVFSKTGFIAPADNIPSAADIATVKKDPTFNKRLEGFTLPLTPVQMEYFLDHLQEASLLLNEYGIHTLRIENDGTGRFHAEDESGLEGYFMLLNNSFHRREYAGSGSISSRVIPRIGADVVADIRFAESEKGGITNSLEFWVRVDSVIVDLLCRIFQPILLQILTRKFDHFITVVQQFTESIREDPEKAAMALLDGGSFESDVEEFRKAFLLP